MDCEGCEYYLSEELSDASVLSRFDNVMGMFHYEPGIAAVVGREKLSRMYEAMRWRNWSVRLKHLEAVSRSLPE